MHLARMVTLPEAPERGSSRFVLISWINNVTRIYGFSSVLDVFAADVEETMSTLAYPPEDRSKNFVDKFRKNQVKALSKLFDQFDEAIIKTVALPTYMQRITNACNFGTNEEKQRIGTLSSTFAAALTPALLYESTGLCMSLSKLSLSQYEPVDIETFDFKVVRDLEDTNAPILSNLLRTVFTSKTAGTRIAKATAVKEAGNGVPLKDSKDDGAKLKRDKHLIITTAIATLCFAKSKNANLVQGMTGYFLMSSAAGKRVVAVLNRIGVSVSYSGVCTTQRSIAENAKMNVVAKASNLRWILSFDNMNYMSYMKYVLLHKNQFFRCDTAPWIYFDSNAEDGGVGHFVLSEDIKREKSREVSAEDIIPSIEDNQYYIDAAVSHILASFKENFKDEFAARLAFEKANGLDRTKQRLKLPKLNVLPKKRSDIHTLPFMPLDEIKIAEVVEILQTLMDEIGVDPNSMGGKIAMIKGDWLTVRNILIAMFQLQDGEDPSETFEFFEPVMGLFHLNMNVVRLFMSTYWGKADGKDPNSFARFAATSRNNKVDQKGKDFRACSLFLDTVLESHILAKGVEEIGKRIGIAVQGRANDKVEHLNLIFRTRPETAEPLDFEAVATAIAVELYDCNTIPELRSADTRDILFENSNIILRDLMSLRDYKHAVRSGDTGRIEKIVVFWCVLFQGTRRNNYSAETIHLVACLRKLWQPKFRAFWLRNCLVNPTGDAWMEDDLFGEYVVRELKKRLAGTASSVTEEFIRNIVARQTMVMLASRRNMYKITQSSTYGFKSAPPNTESTISLFTRHLFEANAFEKQQGGRTLARANDDRELVSFRDLFGEGVANLCAGFSIKTFRDKSRANWDSGKAENLEDILSYDSEALDALITVEAEDRMFAEEMREV